MSNDKSKIYFANLDVLRFIAAALVVVYHIEHKKTFFGYDSLLHIYFFRNIGDIAVTIFFVLSGFIITYLLLTEHGNTGRINIPKFYMRRILRIWPLYYLIILLGFFVLPHIPQLHIPVQSLSWSHLTVDNLLLYLFFLPNLVFTFFPDIPYINQAWSIGVEEQFYILWPLLLFATHKNMRFFLVFILITFIVCNRYFTNMWVDALYNDIPTSYPLKTFLSHERFTCMGIGGLGAYFLYNKIRFRHLLSFLSRREMQVFFCFTTIFFLVYELNKWGVALAAVSITLAIASRKKTISTIVLTIGAAIMIIAGINGNIAHSSLLHYFTHEILSVLFCVIIINLAQQESSFININNKSILYLGKISYGIYMYHNIFIVLSMHIIAGITHPGLHQLSLYICSFILTIAASSLSYELYEKYFLKLKQKRFTVIKSGVQP